MNPPIPPELRALRDFLTASDPMPAAVTQSGYAALAHVQDWKNVRAQQLELVSDSMDTPAATRFVGRTSRPRSRVLTYMMPGRIIEMDLVTTSPGAFQATGIVIDRAGRGVVSGEVVVRFPGGQRCGQLDRHGSFQVDDVPSGPLSVVFRPTEGAPAIAKWLVC